MMPETKNLTLIKPNENTPFHIDFAWWKERDQNWHVDLKSMLCSEHQDLGNAYSEEKMIDWVDPDTGEVTEMDGLQHLVTSHCAKQEGFLTDHTTMVDAVFRTFLSNGNTPLSAKELSQTMARPSDLILRTIAGARIYKGIRPFTK